MIEDKLLLSNLKPGRYIGHEWNVTKKDFSRVKLSVCLSFPDIYDIGMSNLGVRILYDILNSRHDIACERVFCPWPDFAKTLRDNSLELSSLESQTPISKFDIVGFSIDNELNYTNILSILSLSNIPLYAKDRPIGSPLIIGGGNCVFNPEPLADFFDLFVVGEAENVMLEITKVAKKFKKSFGSVSKHKKDLLIELSQIPGIYVPSFYNVEYDSDFNVKEFAPLVKYAPGLIKKQYVKDLNKNLYPQKWIIPNIEIVHDRIGIEIMRGCMHSCRFCQARNYFYPLRIRNAKNILNLAKKLYKQTGYEEISLLSLSSSNHPQIEEISRCLLGYFQNKGVNISLPSIRPASVVGDLSRLFSAGQRKTGLTFAPEAGSEKLRRVINKDFDMESLFKVTREAFSAGYRRIKLYFMIGLPKEDNSDLDAIVDLVLQLSNLRKEVSNRKAEINISLSSFIPKPHTPFQWLNMDSMGTILNKQRYISDLLKSKFNIDLSFHDVHMSYLEAVLTRGHRDLSKIIVSSFNKGAQFDQWRDYFNFNIWKGSFNEYGIDLEEFARRQITLDKKLIWDFIDVGVDKKYLKEEFQKALT